ncbi:BTAD domain-containing putative transcriptional regulator [Actinokineospora sp. NPDC004072]
MTAGGVPVTGALRRTLLGVLLAEANRPVAVDALVEALWRAPDPRARQKLHLHVHKLRRDLGGDRIEHGPAGYALRVRPGELDAERFDALVAEALAAADPARRARLLRSAVGLWRGTPYAGLDVPALDAAAQRLGERRLTALEELHEAEIELGGHAAAAAELAALTREHPLRERLHALLVLALHRDGRQADALAAYRAARATVVAELGVEPGPQLRAVAAAVLAGGQPAQLPADVRAFVGRAAELAELDAGPLVAVTGTAGAGKTALVVRWAHRARSRFPDGQLHVDLRGYAPDRPVPAAAALAGFLRALGVPGPAIPTDPAERAARFRSLVDGRRLLVVLDNAADSDHVRPLLSSATTVVTSRDSLAGLVAREGARRVVLDRLPVAEARGLLTALIGAPAPELAERCARLPLALRVAAELVRLRPEALAELTRERARLDLLDAGGDPATAVRAVFSWSYRNLPPQAARLFRLCGHRVGPVADPPSLAALADLPEADAHRAVDALVRAHLLERAAEGRYQMHDLLSAYAAELADGGEAEAAISRQVDWYARTAEGACPRWLDRELPALLKAAELRPDAAPRLSAALWKHLDNQGRATEALALHGRALAVRPDPSTRVRLGVAHLRLGQAAEAERCFTAARHDPRAAASALNNLALLRMGQGRPGDALPLAEAALVSAGGDERTAAIRLNLGDIRRATGDLAAARRDLDAALAAARARGDRLAESFALCHLAHLHLDADRLPEAAAAVEQALAVAAEVGSGLVTAEATHHAGTLRLRAGDRNGAVALYRRALAKAEAIGHRGQAAATRGALAELALVGSR